ncbi:unnamed protein product, partial [marine sediment metagenome]
MEKTRERQRMGEAEEINDETYVATEKEEEEAEVLYKEYERKGFVLKPGSRLPSEGLYKNAIKKIEEKYGGDDND